MNGPLPWEELVLVPATPAQAKLTWTRTLSVWGKGLTLEQYHEREHMLANTDFARDNLQVYVLVPKDDPTTLNPLAHCDVYKRPCWQLLWSERRGDPDLPYCQLVEGDAYSVASVFCPPEYRGHGYGSAMIRQLYALLKRNRATPSLSSLYSDIGPKFYGRSGWVMYPAEQINVPVNAQVTRPSSLQRIKRLTDLMAVPLIDQDCADLKRRLITMGFERSQRAVDPGYVKSNSVLIVPNRATYRWHWARAIYMGPILGTTVPECVGASVPRLLATPSSEVGPSFMLWFHDFAAKALIVLRTRLAQPSDLELLLQAATDEALAHHLEQIELWSLEDPDTLGVVTSMVRLSKIPAYFNAKKIERTHSLPGLATFYSDTLADTTISEWLCNDRYAWV
ncbi:hypothetical protein H4R35_004832 [Dimargaris xerosporica]|nr:hypothetical protein H4R35_004832 [Dimargaris xerosporica]